MKYIVRRGSDLFDKLQEVRKRMKKANATANAFARSMGGQAIAHRTSHVAGRPDGIKFDKKPDQSWKPVGNRWDRLYMPKAHEKKLWREIRALPVVLASELQKIISFGDDFHSDGNALVYVTLPGIDWKKEYILVDVPDGCKGYVPPEGMEEILGSEYSSLKKAKSILA